MQNGGSEKSARSSLPRFVLTSYVTCLGGCGGLVNYVRIFIPNMAGVTAPLTDLLRPGTEHRLGEKEQAAFSALKIFLCLASVLRIVDPHSPFEVITVASDIAIGAVLLQDFGEGLQPIAYESRKLHPPERNYLIHDKEMLAIVHAFKVWRCYLTSADGCYDTIFIIIDKLTKMAHFPACKKSISAKETTHIFISSIVRLYGIPSAIISDRDTEFTRNFMCYLWEQFGKPLQFSSAYHPETDG
ncbi:hypothetical protein CLOM_g15178 [Closterium sp. NIES-68]|nr:hypothetical protein CLOM_g15178 [Closterium sp. NIES-68]